MPKHKPIKGEREIRAFALPDITADPEGDVVQGHAAVFGQPYDMYGMWTETIARGAFDQTDFTDVLFSVNHDLSRIPLARSRNNNANSTLQLQVDDQGLATRATLDVENNADARALYSAVGRGDISGMSYIFAIADDEWTGLDSDMPQRTITAIAKVYEVSAVSMPANPGTDISARGASALDSAKRTLESARARSLDSDAERRKRLIAFTYL
ncbi:HK97 family phage prohead protease [Ethanoligenens sp.]|uniref:HK97 family phage prohead protease n=1 Tax=Ethanoligenens sp. TaxID=2099655 RepID=UPI0039E7ADE0